MRGSRQRSLFPIKLSLFAKTPPIPTTDFPLAPPPSPDRTQGALELMATQQLLPTRGISPRLSNQLYPNPPGVYAQHYSPAPIQGANQGSPSPRGIELTNLQPRRHPNDSSPVRICRLKTASSRWKSKAQRGAMLRVGQAVEDLHMKGLFHTDVKPHNIMIRCWSPCTEHFHQLLFQHEIEREIVVLQEKAQQKLYRGLNGIMRSNYKHKISRLEKELTGP
ncbi:unnamed protein product [Fusarium fujikuroi]|nr:unnamed protein product [Fusarium fujikuroi]